MRKIFIISILICISLITSSCEIYSNPNSLIVPPKLKANEVSQKDNINEITKKFLPTGFEVLKKNEIATSKPIEFVDIDKDKSYEIIVFFENGDTKGFMVLKKKSGLWHKEYQKLIKCQFITKFAFLNVFEKNKKSIIIGFSIDDDIGAEYDAYTYTDNGIEERSMGTWNKFDIVRNLDSAGNEFTIAGWRKYGYDYLVVDFVKFNSKGAYLSDDYYPEYYSKAIDYYKNILKDMLKYKAPTQFAWYGMVRTEIESGEAEKALSDLKTVNKIKGSFPLTAEMVDFLEAETYIKLNKLNEAQMSLDKAIAEKNNYPVEEAREVAYMYLENARVLEKLSSKEKAKEMLNKASDIFTKLKKENYYSNNKNMNIYKELDANAIQNEYSGLNN